MTTLKRREPFENNGAKGVYCQGFNSCLKFPGLSHIVPKDNTSAMYVAVLAFALIGEREMTLAIAARIFTCKIP